MPRRWQPTLPATFQSLPAAGRRIDRPAQVNAINGPEPTLNIVTGALSSRARRRTNAIRRHA